MVPNGSYSIAADGTVGITWNCGVFGYLNFIPIAAASFAYPASNYALSGARQIGWEMFIYRIHNPSRPCDNASMIIIYSNDIQWFDSEYCAATVHYFENEKNRSIIF